ncbi:MULTISPECIES: hypothetical protein [unclassified Acidocella]|uniref:hypothetical protein n=1 Tax=unclassified Acidocella TaxID=2648610 RepID=UPI00028DC284|nr:MULTISPECIES: hypothetical protein [unclassified Acidocella]EKN00979.1 hypothetical protein MXAZACID_02440 [Acidocella sp. MX-AZ02]WBO60540.1 hypothetical protein GT370_07155 [Acidocella sp. MX-AZ03]
MANLSESDSFDAGIYQLETTDAALGGVNGVMNTQGKSFANRTRWLYNRVIALLGFTSQYATAAGKANAIIANYTPAATAPINDGACFAFRATAANTGPATFTPCDGSVAGTTAIPPLPIFGADMNALAGGEITGQARLRYSTKVNGGNGGYVLVENPGGIQRSITPPAPDDSSAVATTNWVRFIAALLSDFSQSGQLVGYMVPGASGSRSLNISFTPPQNGTIMLNCQAVSSTTVLNSLSLGITSGGTIMGNNLGPGAGSFWTSSNMGVGTAIISVTAGVQLKGTLTANNGTTNSDVGVGFWGLFIPHD